MGKPGICVREWLQNSRNGFHVVKALPPGEYWYLFIVDGYLRYAADSPCVFDASGSAYNVLDLQVNFSHDLPIPLNVLEVSLFPFSSYICDSSLHLSFILFSTEHSL